MTEEELKKYPWQVVVFWACDCAERALRREKAEGRDPDERAWIAVKTAREFMAGEVSEEQIQAAAKDAEIANEAAFESCKDKLASEYARRADRRLLSLEAPLSTTQSAWAAVEASWVGLSARMHEAGEPLGQVTEAADRYAAALSAKYAVETALVSVKSAHEAAIRRADEGEQEERWQKRRLSWLMKEWTREGKGAHFLLLDEDSCPEGTRLNWRLG